jgi:hypothetical protein
MFIFLKVNEQGKKLSESLIAHSIAVSLVFSHNFTLANSYSQINYL